MIIDYLRDKELISDKEENASLTSLKWLEVEERAKEREADLKVKELQLREKELEVQLRLKELELSRTAATVPPSKSTTESGGRETVFDVSKCVKFVPTF